MRDLHTGTIFDHVRDLEENLPVRFGHLVYSGEGGVEHGPVEPRIHFMPTD